MLDEPTNHLDLWARDALEQALREFDGTVLFVSHDRYFVNRVADHLLVVEPGRVRVIEGNYETYHLLQSCKAEADRLPQRKRPRGGLSSRRAKAKGGTRSSARWKSPPKTSPRGGGSPSARRTTSNAKSTRGKRWSNTSTNSSPCPKSSATATASALKSQIAEEQEALKTLYEHWEEAWI